MPNNSLISDDSKLDLIIESFESAYCTGELPTIEEYLPDRADPDFQEVLLELLRVDMEHRWRRGKPKRLTKYMQQFEGKLCDTRIASQLAFEEYRLRIESGEPVDKSTYERISYVSVDDWPIVPENRIDNNDTLSANQASTEFDSLPNSIASFPDIGDIVAGFCLLKQIGCGKFGRVFLAEQNCLSARLVVLKITTIHSIEPQRLAQLQHTNIVPIHSEHQIEDLQIVCMPFFGETTIAHVIAKIRNSDFEKSTGELIRKAVRDPATYASGNDGFDHRWNKLCQKSYVDACLHLAVQIADGLLHAHDRGILHRDFKPANILLADDGRPLLLDFNLAEQIVPGGIASLLVGGTIPYMSPEQLRSLDAPEPIDQRTDIFSFGVVFYELLTGSRPFSDRNEGTRVSDMVADRSRPITSPRDFNREIPLSICDLLSKCMSPNVEARFDGFDQIITDLNRHFARRPLIHTPNRSLQERVTKWARRNPRLLSLTSIAILSFILVGSLVTSFFIHRHRSQAAQARETVHAVAEMLSGLHVDVGSADTSVSTIRTGRQRLLEACQQLRISYDEPHATMRKLLSGDDLAELSRVRRETLFLLSHATERLARHATDSTERQRLLEEALAHIRLIEAISSENAQQIQIDAQESDILQMLKNESLVRRNIPAVFSENSPMAILNLLRRGLYSDAIPILEEMRESDPLEFSTWFHLGECYFAVGRQSDAVSCFSTCCVLWQNSPKAFLYRGICRLSTNEYSKAENDFDRALVLRNNWDAALFNRSLARRGQRNLRGAEDDLNQIIRDGDPSSRTYFLRARIRKQLGEIDDAASDFESAMAMHPDDYRDYIVRGMTRLHSHPKLALQDFKDALRLSPASRKAMRNMIYVLSEKLNNEQSALLVAEQLINRLGETADDVMSRAVLRARLGDLGASTKDTQRALGIRTDAKLYFQAACVYALGGNEQQRSVAVDYLTKSIEADIKWLARLADPDLDSIRMDDGFKKLAELSDAYRATKEN